MTKKELRSLRALARRLQRESERLNREAKRDYKNAGHSGPGGTGDEGWRDVFLTYGQADGIACAVFELEAFIAKHGGEK